MTIMPPGHGGKEGEFRPGYRIENSPNEMLLFQTNLIKDIYKELEPLFNQLLPEVNQEILQNTEVEGKVGLYPVNGIIQPDLRLKEFYNTVSSQVKTDFKKPNGYSLMWYQSGGPDILSVTNFLENNGEAVVIDLHDPLGSTIGVVERDPKVKDYIKMQMIRKLQVGYYTNPPDIFTSSNRLLLTLMDMYFAGVDIDSFEVVEKKNLEQEVNFLGVALPSMTKITYKTRNGKTINQTFLTGVFIQHDLSHPTSVEEEFIAQEMKLIQERHPQEIPLVLSRADGKEDSPVTQNLIGIIVEADVFADTGVSATHIKLRARNKGIATQEIKINRKKYSQINPGPIDITADFAQRKKLAWGYATIGLEQVELFRMGKKENIFHERAFLRRMVNA